MAAVRQPLPTHIARLVVGRMEWPPTCQWMIKGSPEQVRLCMGGGEIGGRGRAVEGKMKGMGRSGLGGAQIWQ